MLRVHNLLVTLDGYATGDGQSLNAAFGHAQDEFLHWFGRARNWRGLQPDANLGPDEAIAAAWGAAIGDTTFHFVSGTPAEVLALAEAAAGGLDVRLGGGPTTVNEFLAAGLVDYLHVVLAPIVIGRGVRLWDGLEGLHQRYDVESVTVPNGVTHLFFTKRSGPRHPTG